MNWGIYLLTAQIPGSSEEETIANSVRYAREAEAQGYEHAWVLEHHFTRYGIVGSALTQAAFLLGQTEKLKIGTAINVIPLEHPVRLAEEVALIDHLSQGRLMFGIGRGVFLKDYAVFGCDIERNREMLDIWYEKIMEAWTEPTVSSDHELLTFPEITVYPRPFTKPCPPMYAVAQSPDTIEWCAEKGLPMLLNYTISDEAKRAQLDLYNDIAYSYGHDVDAIPHTLSLMVGCSLDGDVIRKQSRDHLSWWLEEFLRASELFKRVGDNVNGYEWQKRQWEEMVMRNEQKIEDRVERYFKMNPIGSPQECIDKLANTLEVTGLQQTILGFEAAGSYQNVMDSMQVFREAVLCHFDFNGNQL